MNELDISRAELLETVKSFEKENIKAEEEKEEVKEEIEEVDTEEKEIEEEEENEAKEEESEDDKKIFDGKGDIYKQLSGQPKEFRDAVSSIKDPEAQAKVIEAGKLLRAREDQVRLELGNTKKEMANLKAFDEAFKKDPIQTLKDLAKFAKVDLNSLITVEEEEYDYRTPEEIAKDDKLKNIESELNQLKNSKRQELNDLINDEIDNFANLENENGDLKYPYFDKLESEIFDILAIMNKKQGYPTNAKERKERLAAAYKKAELMDDDLVRERDSRIAKKAEDERKKELEKAKKLKKFSGRTSNVEVKQANERAEILDIVRKYGVV